MKRSLLFVCLFSVYASGNASLPDSLPQLSTAPQIDGIIEESEWEQAYYLGNITPSLPQTHAWIALDDTHLYLAVRAQEPAPEKIRTTVIGDEIQAPVWNDDSIEVLLDLENQGQIIHRLVFNTEGSYYNSLMMNNREQPNSWNSDATIQTRVTDSHWEAEVAIPLHRMGHLIQRGELIALNIGRYRYVEGKRQTESLTGSGFIVPTRFKRLLVIEPMRAGEISLISTRRGPFIEENEGVWEFSVIAGKLEADSLGIALPLIPASQEVQVQFDGQTLKIPVAPHQVKEMSQLSLHYKDENLYHAQYEPRRAASPSRIRQTTDPLFESLIEPFSDGLSKLGTINWAHELNRGLIQVVPFRTGMAYQHNQTPYENYKRDRSILLVTLGWIQQNPKIFELLHKYDIPVAVYLRKKASAIEKGAPHFGPRKRVYFLDPRAIESYLENARKTIQLSKQHPQIQWLFAGDEVWEHMHITLKEALDQNLDYPELREIDKQIREKYGFGKYGLPESSTDTNPYRWIATYRWEIDQMDRVARQVRELIDTEAPNLKFLSWDCMTGHRPYSIGNWGEIFDVVTAQIYPASSKGRDHLGFTTKFYKDISNAKELWPVPHVEHYPNSFTVEEVEEMLSRVFRQGATGLHLWTSDYINQNRHQKGGSINERIGAPERWHVVRSVIDRLETPFKVKQPTPDAAVFYSNTSYQGTGAPKTFNSANYNEWLYTILGPNLRSTFRFMDEPKISAPQANLSAYKVIYIPFAPIVDDQEYEALQAYVENGGTLIVCDPLAFRNRSDGTARTQGSILPPLQSLTPDIPRPIKYINNSKPLTLSALNPTYNFIHGRGKVLAEYNNNQPAVIEATHGKGKVIFFGESPLTLDVLLNKPWIGFFEFLQQRENLTMGHDYWRFRFPSVAPYSTERPAGLCLTGNYFEWSLSRPKPTANSYTGGTYQFDQPTLNKSEPVNQPIPFNKGKLTDRVRGAQAANDAKPETFILRWRMGQPLNLVSHFPRPVTVETIRLFYSGTLPEGVCEISVDGENWQSIGKWDSQKVESHHDVNQLDISFPKSEQTQYIRLHFKENAKNPFTLAEFDIWGYE